MMNIKKFAVGLSFGLSVVCLAAQAQQTIHFEDNDVDFLLTPCAESDVGIPGLCAKQGTFASGDVLVSAFELDTWTIDGVSQIPAGQQLTGIAVLQIDTVVGNTVNFVPYTGGFNAVSPVDVVNGGALGGTTVGMWLHATNVDISFGSAPQVTCNSLTECLDLVSTGGLVQVDGFGDLDNAWTSTGLVAGAFNTNTVLGIGGATNVALFNANQTTFFNSSGTIIFQTVLGQTPCPGGTVLLDGCTQGPVLTGTASGGGGTVPLNSGIVGDGAFARSDIDADKLQAPEPAILALLGMGLFGLAVTRRRRK